MEYNSNGRTPSAGVVVPNPLPARSWLWHRPGAPAHPLAVGVFSVLIAVLLAGVLTFFLALSGTAGNWGAVWNYREVFFKGWLLTILLSAASLVLSLIIAALIVALRRAPLVPARAAGSLVVEVIRGSPFLVLILVLFYVVAPGIGITDRLLVGLIALSLFSGAYLAEMLRAGIESVASSQLDSARAIGLNPSQTYRFVIIPQALKQTLPPLAGQLASLIKDSSLLSVIGLSEFTHAAQQINSATYSTIEVFLPLAIGYLILTLPISFLARHLEERFRYDY
jgi:polar amino acid transport system permease protein